MERLNAAGFSAYAVGGCVRDTVLGQTPHDYDMTTSALPQEMQQVFRGERTIETGLKHGTLTVLLQGMPLEITTFRIDGAYGDGRHPDSVTFTRDVTEDLARRDFTINAMAYSPKDGLVDPFGGQTDCRDGVLRCVGDPTKRLEEDALRILRALRFSARLGFPIEAKTAHALFEQKENLAHVSIERITTELNGLLQGKFAADILRQYADILFFVLPELAPIAGFPQRCRYHCYDVWEHTLHVIDRIPATPTLRWAALLHDAAKPVCHVQDAQGNDHFYHHPEKGAAMAEDILRRLRQPNQFIDEVQKLVLYHDSCRREADVYPLLSKLGPEMLSRCLALSLADQLSHAPWLAQRAEADHALYHQRLQALLDQNACYSLAQMAIRGPDLMALGLKGKAIGDTLQKLLAEIVAERIPNERKALLHRAQQLSAGGSIE